MTAKAPRATAYSPTPSSCSDGLGIDLLGGTESAAGVTAIDPGAADSGPNSLQSFPGVTSVGKKAIEGTPNSKPSIAYTVQLFSNPSGEDEGESFVGPSGRPSEGGRALKGLKNARGKDQPMWCLFCHPEHRFLDAVWSGLERMGG